MVNRTNASAVDEPVVTGWRSAGICCLVVAVLLLTLPQTALSDPATSDLDVTAGLTDSITVSCPDALSFGVSQIVTGDRGGSNDVTVTPSGTLTTNGSGVITGGAGQAGECSVSGSLAAEGTGIRIFLKLEETLIFGDVIPSFEENFFYTLSFEGHSGVPLLPAAGSGLGDAALADLPGLLLTNLQLSDTETRTLDDRGATTFRIGGRLQIPNNVNTNQLGAHARTITIEVEVEDSGG